MKKRTLVCFLIFTLCVFYTSIPNTVFGQEVSLADEVFEKYSELFQREDIQAILPEVLEGLKADNIQGILSSNPAIISVVVANPDFLTTVAPDIDPQFITLLKEDDDLKALLSDPQVQSLLADIEAIDELAGLLAVGAPPDDTMVDDTVTDDTVTDDTMVDDTVTDDTMVDDTVTDDTMVDDTVTDDTMVDDTVTDDTMVDDTVTDDTMVDDTVTDDTMVDDTVTDDTMVDDTVTDDTMVDDTVIDDTVIDDTMVDDTVIDDTMVDDTVIDDTIADEVPVVDPFERIMPTNDYLWGKSRLGGLSLNAASGRGFVEDIIRASGLPLEADALVDAILDAVPQGYLPKKQIRQILMSDRLSVFAQEAKQLDYENFGNAITPNFADFAYVEASSKHLTRDNLHVYMRVPAEVGGVTFSLTGGQTVEGTQVTGDEFQADTISYTFQLDETLAATNLPAWPSLNTQLFSRVTLRYSNMGPKADYIAVDMMPMVGKNGVVWETEIGIPPGRSTYYYFEVILAEPVKFKTLDRDAIAAMDPTTVTLAEVLSPSAIKTYEIAGWAMPDPRNLQMVDRGIIDELFTPNLSRAITDILNSPRANNIVQKALAGQQVSINEFLSAATPRQQNRIRTILERNANRIKTKFETAFDPMLASVFTVPKVNPETESLWVAHIEDIADADYDLYALVYDADGTPLDDVLVEMLTVDTSAPAADIQIMPGDGKHYRLYERRRCLCCHCCWRRCCNAQYHGYAEGCC